jgi:dTDP-glucose pyrophosphorylase
LSIRPTLDSKLAADVFRSYYYLKEELIDFCRKEGLQSSGGKIELTDRIALYLDTGQRSSVKKKSISFTNVSEITPDSLIEDDFVCSERNRAFFKETIGKGFSFNVAFQKWLKSNAGKSYDDAICAYYQILNEKKESKSTIDKQFEYNTYIRDFFSDNKGKTLADAILCWKYKKEMQGHNKYEESDLVALG